MNTQWMEIMNQRLDAVIAERDELRQRLAAVIAERDEMKISMRLWIAAAIVNTLAAAVVAFVR